MLTAVASVAHPSSLTPPPFLVADQEGHDRYRIHVFDSWDSFRLWCKAHRPRHMVAPTCAHGSRLWPDIDHLGECDGEMLLAQAREDRREDERRRLEAARRIVRTGHDADVDLVAVADAARAKRQARKQSIRSMTGLFNWCIVNNINFDYIPSYLGMPLRQWVQQNPEQPYDKAAMTIELRRDAQPFPEVE